MSYHERLRVPSWWHLGSLGFGVLIGGEAVLSIDPLIAAVVIAIFVALAELVLWSMGRREVLVDAGKITAGEWRLPVAAVRGVALLDAEQMRAEQKRADPSVYRCTVGWIRTGVLLDVDDPQDSPLWLVSARDPGALAAALADEVG